MMRRAAALVLALTLNPALLYAQDTVMTVNVQSADIHQGPSIGTPIVGHVSRGTVLPVSRNLGSWVRVAWPDAKDGFGYVHVSLGRLGAPKVGAPTVGAPVRAASSSASAPPAAPSAADPAEAIAVAPQTHKPTERVGVTGRQGDAPITHIVGIGGLVGSMDSFGATARVWRNAHLGLQLGVTRDAMTSDTAAGRVTSMQFEPGIVYALMDHISDYVWFRPYVGSVVSFRHQTLKASPTPDAAPLSDNGIGYRVFGGSELTFAGVTRFALSAEVGYRRFPTAFPGFAADRLGITVAGHWYVK